MFALWRNSMTTTQNLSGEEIPKRFLKPSEKKKREALRKALLKFEKDKKSKNKKKMTAGDIIRRKNLEDMAQ